MSEAAPAGREFFLDWLRILAFGTLVVYHVGMYYVSWEWHIKSPAASTLIEPVMRLFSPWRMDLIFLVSGAATAFLMRRRRGPAELLRDRAFRLLLPLLFGVLVVVPPQSWREVIQRFGFEGSYGAFLMRYLSADGGFCAAGKCLILPTWNHLWYLPYLFCYTALLALTMRPGLAWPDRLGQWLGQRLTGPVLLMIPLGYLILTRVLLRERFPATHALVDDWYLHAQYLFMFLLGVVLARTPGVWARLADWRWSALGLALMAWLVLESFPAWSHLMAREPARLLGSTLFSLQQWAAIIAALGFGWRHLRVDSAARQYLTDAVFPVYLLHQTLIILLAAAMAHFAWPAGIEAGLLLAGTLLFSFLIFEVVRRVGWLRPLFGLKRFGI